MQVVVMAILPLIILMTLSVPLAYAQQGPNCSIFDLKTTQGTNGYSHRIEDKQIIFQWKRVKDGYEMELKTNDTSADWVGIGFCREPKICMDNCAYAILWRPETGKPKMADCFVPAIPAKFKPFKYATRNGPQCDKNTTFLKVTSASYSDTHGLEGKFMRKLQSNFSGPNFKLDGDMLLVWARGLMDEKTRPDLGSRLKNGMLHLDQCGRSIKPIFKVAKYQGNQSKGQLFLETSVLLTCIGYLLIST